MKDEQVPSIYGYQDPADFLRDFLRLRQTVNPRFSLRSWSRQMGLKSHVHLSLILNSKRKLKPEMAQKIRSRIPMSDSERRYFDLLVLLQNSRSDHERELIEEALRLLSPHQKFTVLENERLRTFSDWRHLAVLEMLRLKAFKADPQWISERLGGAVDLQEAKKIMGRLERAGLIKVNGSGDWLQESALRKTSNDIPSQVIRLLQAQYLDLAKEALDKQSLQEREFSSFTFSLKKKDMTEAKEMLRAFRQAFIKRFDLQGGDDVYQFSLQLFRLTTSNNKESK